jgi:hypothetical protein
MQKELFILIFNRLFRGQVFANMVQRRLFNKANMSDD